MIQAGAQVSIHYELVVEGELIQSSKNEGPVDYVHGQGQILPGLEEQLQGATQGDVLKLKLPPEKGYGVHDPTAVESVTKGVFTDPAGLKPGTVVKGKKSDGSDFQATVAEVEKDQVVLDLNHPLAGKTLEFRVEVMMITPAGA